MGFCLHYSPLTTHSSLRGTRSGVSCGELIIASGLGRSFLDAARFEAERDNLKVAGALRKPLDLQALRELLIELAAKDGAGLTMG